MKQRPRIYYSSEQRNLMWDRWQKGKIISLDVYTNFAQSIGQFQRLTPNRDTSVTVKNWQRNSVLSYLLRYPHRIDKCH